MLDPQNPSAVTLTVAGCGGCGTNLARVFVGSSKLTKVQYFDTSMVNTQAGESCHIVGSGSGSGSNRAENAKDIERAIPQMTDEEIGKNDVAIVIFSLAGGSGSVIGPLLIRDYARRGVKTIGVVVGDSSYSRGAENSLNTLKTLTAIAKNGDLYLPLIFLSNDLASRRDVDQAAAVMISDLVDLLTNSVYEVDRNDRLNWIDPSKIITSNGGLKLISFIAGSTLPNPKAVIGLDSKEMVDSLLILQKPEDETVELNRALPPSRLKKVGFYPNDGKRLVGRITSDINAIEAIINLVEQTQTQDKAQKHATIDRLTSNSNDDLII